MKKFVNILTLIIMVSVNFMTPFAYAQTDTQEVDFFQETENFDENNEENSDEIKTSDASDEDDEIAEIEDSENSSDIEEKSEDFEIAGDDESGINTGDNKQEPGINTGDNKQEPETNTGDNEQEPGINTGDNEQEPETNTGDNEQEPETNTGDNEQEPGINTGDNKQEPGINTGDNKQEPETNTGDNEQEPEINTELWEQGEDFYDIIYTGIVRGREYTITFMDRNLGALTTDTQEEDSYGYYYQWGNSYPFSHHTQLNQYTTNQVDASGYGPDNRYRGENFIKGHEDWSSASNSNLWGGGLDSIENDYNDESDRQGPCPEGYHVPSVGEWHALFSCFLVNNGISEATTDGLEYPNYIGKERHAAYYLGSEDIEKFKSTFNISYAGRIKQDGSVDRTGEMTHFWTSTPMNNTALGFEVWDDRINLGGWETARSTGYPVRCFKSVEYELVDYTVTYMDGENEITETKHWGDVLTEPEHTDKGEGYNRLGWYSRGIKFDFSTPITGDITLVATWGCSNDYHIEDGLCKPNTKTVNCKQIGGVENSAYIVTGMEITRDITGGKWEEIPTCDWKCLEDYHLTGGQCESNTKTVECVQTGGVENSTYIVTGVVIVWDITGGVRNETPACEWKCNVHHHLSGDACDIDRFMFTLVENVHVNTSGSTETGKKPYDSKIELSAESHEGYRFLGWQILGLNGTGTSHISVSNEVVFNMPDSDVTATPLSETIEYKIVYRNVDDAIVDNLTTYTIETETFTLNNPIKTGYIFLGWTGSNGAEPEKNVTVTKGTTGNKRYTAVWEPMSGINYQVVHAVEKANSTTYDVRETETLTGTTDQMTEAVAKEYTGFTAKEITQKVIKGDGSTVVRVQYQRNIYTITFDSNGGSEISPITGKYESNLTAPSNPTKKGYIFNGWKPSFPSTMPLSGAELVAQWRRPSGGSSSSEETQVTTGTNNVTTGKVEEIVEEVQNLDIDAGTSIAPMVMRSMKLGSMMLMSVGPGIIEPELPIECDTGYVLNQDGTECVEGYTVTFDANGGEVNPVYKIFELGSTTYGELPIPTKDNSVFSGWSILPDEYQAVEYIQSNGSQYIDTLVSAKSGISSDITFSFVSVPSDASILAARKSSDRLYLLHYYRGFTYGYGNYYNNGGSASANVIYNVKTVLNAGSQSMIIDGVTKMSHNISDSKNLNLNLYLFAANNGGSMAYPSSIKLYQLKIYDESDLIRYFVPCVRNSDNVAGLYDLVEGRFYTNKGSGKFAVGNSVNNMVDENSTINNESDHTLYAKWFCEEGYFDNSSGCIASYPVTLTFDPQNGEELITQQIMAGEKITMLPNLTKEGYVLLGWYVDTGYTQIFDMSKGLYADTLIYAKWHQPQPNDIILEATDAEANQTLKINKYFANAYTVDRGDGTTGNLTADTRHTYAAAGTYVITLSTTTDRWRFQNVSKPLVPKDGTTMTSVKIIYMPSLAEGFEKNEDFFRYFNYNGALTSLPTGSFDTSNFNTAGSYFFAYFNYNGALTSLPPGSFDISNIREVYGSFFRCFNYNGALTSLPEDSFNISKITTVGDYFFAYFNYNGALTSLPGGSFDTSNITSIGYYFFEEFNQNGALTSLPERSFRLSTGLTGATPSFFYGFNQNGALTSLPEGSFDTSNITTAEPSFFTRFNYNGALTSLPESFKLNSVAYNGSNSYQDAFNSPSYTLNRNVSEIVSGVTAPSSDRNTFSDNQPGRCGVHENWLVNPANGCDVTITFNTNGGSPISGMVTNAGGTIILPASSKTGYILDGWYTEQTGGTLVGNVGNIYTGTSSTTLYAHWSPTKNIILEATSTSSNQTLKINKYFANVYTVDRGDGTPVTGLIADITHTYDEPGTYTIILSPAEGADRWTFQNVTKPLVPKDGTTVTGVKITYMPSLADGFGENAANPGDSFFSSFNNNGALISLPSGSFDTSNITSVGYSFFSSFNNNGALISLPSGSFDTSNITSVGYSFFSSFNNNGALISLPSGSFDTSNITSVGHNFFFNFNKNGVLTSLPEGSFDTSKITIVGDSFFSHFNESGALTSLPDNSFDISNISGSVGSYFFYEFNLNGQLINLPEGSFDTTNIRVAGDKFFSNFNEGGVLTSLPEGSFDTSNITSVGDDFFNAFNFNGQLINLPERSFDISNITSAGNFFFRSFNNGGSLISLPEGSFDTSNITLHGTYYFAYFNRYGALTSLPEGSFDTSKMIGRNYSFMYFNYNGALTSLPEGSFDTSNITFAGYEFFEGFNQNGQLTSLPEGSFDTSNITTAGWYFFAYFNQNGSLTSLPEGSFDTSNITSTSLGTHYLFHFNYNGKITNLPNSFKLTSAAYNKSNAYYYAFNSSNYALNRKVSDIVSGLRVPSTDKNTFSDNQPGRCGVHKNWLVTTADACSISYDDGLGGTGTFKYTADTIGVVVGSGITVPTRSGYDFLGWYTASGEKVDEVVFPDMDGQTLYAGWNEIYTIIYNLNGGTDSLPNPTSYTLESGNIQINRPTRTGYMFMGWTGSNGSNPDPDIVILSGSTGNKTYNAVWLPFDDLNIYTVSNTGNITHHTIMDRNMGASTNDISSSNSYGSYYKWGNNQGYAGDLSSWTSIPVGTWTEGEQGPCPDGYHVPDKSDLVGLGFDWARSMGITPPASEIGVIFDDNTLFDSIKHDFLVSLGGGKASNNGTLYGTELYVSWHSSEQYSQTNDYIFRFSQEGRDRLFKVGSTNKNSGYPVRCFKNSPISRDLTIYPNGGTGAVIVFTGEVGNGKIITLGTPKKANSVFGGWYSNAELTTSVTIGSTVPANLYARWSCNTGYVQNIAGDGCTKVYTITYNLNGGIETTANPTSYTVESGTFGLYQPTKTGAMFLGWTGTNGNEVKANIYITKGSTGNRTYNAVWGTYEDIDAYFISNTGAVSYITLMDRNMGANTDDITSTGSYGFHYQRGNNHGFQIGCWTNGCNDIVTTLSTGTRLVWNSGYDNRGYNGTFFIGTNSPFDYWTDSAANNANHANLWGGGDDGVSNGRGLSIITPENVGNRQGPCPDGYHVPSMGEWNNLLKYWAAAYTGEGNNLILNVGGVGLNSFSDSLAKSIILRDFNISIGGYRHQTSANYKGGGGEAEYWASSPNNWTKLDYARYLNIDGDLVAANYTTNRTWGHLVRCFSNDYMFTSPSMTIHPNGGTGAMILVDGGTIKSLGMPKRDSLSTFGGWYSTPNFAVGSEVTTGDTAPANLYAKWDCDIGYVDNGSGCILPQYIVNHYKHKLKSTVSDLILTETFSGALDSEVALKDFAKFITGYTYKAGYVDTGTTTEPTSGAVTTTTILADGSRVINLYYRPNYLYVQYDANGGIIKAHGGFTASGSLVAVNGNTKILRGLYGGKVGAVDTTTFTANGTDGLHNYNNSNAIYISRQGYTVIAKKEWNSKADGTGTPYNQAGTTYNAQGFVGTDMTTGDAVATVYVNWVPITYTVAYNLNGGAYGTGHPTTAIYDTGFVVDNPTRDLSTFLGWKITGMDSVTHTYGNSTTTATSIASTNATNYKNLRSTAGTVTFTAQWQCPNGYVDTGTGCVLDIYTITYNLNGGTESRTNPTTYTVASGTFGLYQPTKTGAMFLGWTGTNGNTVNANVYITQGSTGNRTYNAVWGEFEDIDAYFISDRGVVNNVTLMDRNLGASVTGSFERNLTGSYGFKYQWGNNYGFQHECWTNECSDAVTLNSINTKAVWNSGYNNSNFYNYTYIKNRTSPNDYWTDGIHTDLRGGSTDDVSNGRGLSTLTYGNIINRQGPCPNGYHVPSAGEWNNLLKYWGMTYTGEGNELIRNISDTQLNHVAEFLSVAPKFSQDFNIPSAGYRNAYQANTFYSSFNDSRFWSSSTASSQKHRGLSVYLSGLNGAYSAGGAYGMSVRCFSNDYLFTQPSMVIYPNGGTGTMIIVEGNTIKILGAPHRDSHSIFEGWYDADSGGNRIQTGSTAPSNLYARWDCDTGYLQNLSGTACELGNVVTFDANRGTFVANQIILSGQKATIPADPQLPGYTFGGWYTNTGLTTSFNFSTPITGDITLYAKWTYNFTITDLNVYFVESDGSIEHGIIMDRNLGATATYNGNYSNPNTTSYGYYFQWGNNYGFANAGSVSDQSAKIPFNVWSAYIPSKYAKNIFVKGNNSWMNESTPTDNLWGGESSDVLDRQGPCPDGYHIPTSGEWLNLYNYRDNAKTLTLSLGYQWASDFLMPLAGLRGYSRAQLEDQKYDGYYRAANASSVDYAYHFGFYSSLITPNRQYSRANGTSVRCFKNNQTSVMNIYPDGGTGAIITFTGKIVKLGIPKRAGYFFDGWYSTSGFTAGSEVDIGDDVPVNLYAKWLEYFQEYQVDFLANGGEFSDGTSSQTRLYVYNSGTNSYVISGYLSLPNRTGYMFDGWYTDTGYTTERMGTNEEIMLGSIHTLYAKWLSFNDLAIDFGDNVIYIMDRNLGASDIASGTNPYYQPEDVTKLGKYYQWGNNFGFGNLGNLFEVDDKRVNVDEYNVNNKSYYDTTFHTSSISPYSRTLNNNTNLWGGDMTINIEDNPEYKQGPCPIGYHVPDIREWTALSDLYEEWRLSEAGQSFCNNKGYGECFTTKLKLPNAGYRDHGNSTLSNVGNIGFYRSVSPYGDGGFYSYSLGLDKSRLDPTLDTPRALGLSVRCMKNSDDVTIMFNSMGGSEITSLTQKWYISLSGDILPTRANSEFDGWYLNTGYQNQFVGYTSTNKTLYAKRKCDFGYVQNSDQTACEPIAVNFDANGGNFSGGQEIISVMPGIDTESILVTKYSHTPNISDDGTQNGNYENSISTNEVITITGADTLHVTITYATESTSYDWAVVRAGSHPDYTAYSNYGTSVSGKLGGSRTIIEYDIPGDTVTFGFRSDSSVNNYGYYAVITGTGTTSFIAYSGNAFVNVEEPTRTGYTFTGWYLDTGYQNQFDPSNISTGAVTNVYARWISNVYTITYNLNGGTESLPNPTTYTVESGMFGLYQPTKIGYIFLGWTGSNGNEPNANIYIPKGSTGDRTYNAVWGDFEDIDAYFIGDTGIVSYITLMDRNMGANSDDITSTGSYGFHYQWGNNNGFQIGCRNWNNSCRDSDNVAVNATTTKAVWNPNYENKGYNGTRFIKGDNTDYWEGGEFHEGLRGGSSDNANNNYGLDNFTSSNIVNRQGPCPEGYHVPSAKEWENVYKILELSNNVSSVNKLKSLLNLPFAARRSPKDDLSNMPILYGSYWSSTPYNPGVAYFLRIDSTSINVYYNTFGRHTEARSVRCFSNDYLFTQSSMTIHPNGGTGAMILVEGGNIKSLGTPKRSNSKFEGWYSNAALTTAVTTGNTAPANLYAKWSCNAGYVQNVAGDGCTKIYTITYNLNGGINNANNPAKYTVESGAITLQSPTKLGYTFLGWTGSNGSTSQLSVTIPTGSTGDRIYNANWQANTYNISYTMNGGINCGTAPTTATYDTPFTVCNNPTKVGYTFAGWKITGMNAGVTHTYGSKTTTSTSISSTKETNFKNLHSTSGATVTFEALWTINQYDVTVSVNEEGWGGLTEIYRGVALYDNVNSISYMRNYLEPIIVDGTHVRIGTGCAGNDQTLNGVGSLSKKGSSGGGGEPGPGPGVPCVGSRREFYATPTESNAQYTYDFSGWNNECGYSVTHDCEIVAEFTRTLNSYGVTFNSNGGTPVATQNIAYGSKAMRPSDPIRTGYAFAGWRLNGSDFDFNTEITGTINLVAMWNLVGYTITYNLNGGTETTANPTSYTVESGAITLQQPTRVGYTFLGWTGSNGITPQTGVIIPTGSTGDRIYNAEWQANTNTPYTVYHYVKKVGSGTYELAQTEPKQGTSDAILVLSSLAKADGFVCATYDRGSLTGTASGPGEIVTQTTINGDGSTKIYLYYNRNKRKVYLSGDEHVDYLEIDGVVDDEAVRECGGEVPVNAVPKPGYHFVRWDREEREGREDDEVDTHSGGTND